MKRKRANKTKKMQRNKGQKGGAYDTNMDFMFPGNVAFDVNDVLKFETPTIICYIGKKINAFLFSKIPVSRLTQAGVRKLEEIEATVSLDATPSVFYLYGWEQSYKASHCGLFILLNRIQLLAILLQLKSNLRFSSSIPNLNFPIDATSTLPGDYNNFPHGYRWHDREVGHMEPFIKFAQDLQDIEIKLLESFQSPVENIVDVQQKIISGLEIPSFSQMVRMKNLEIIPVGETMRRHAEEERRRDEEIRIENERRDEERRRAEERRRHARNPNPQNPISIFNELIKANADKISTNAAFNDLKPLSMSPSPSDIKTAYKGLALLVHPDKNEGKDEMFKRLRSAYYELKVTYQFAGNKKKKMHK